MRILLILTAALIAGVWLGLAPASAQIRLPNAPALSLFRAVPPRPASLPSALPASAGGLGPGQQCRAAIHTAERAAGIPVQLMAAIGRVESGRREADGSVNPWPWSINAEGEDHVFDTKAEAITAVRALQARGVRSIDAGCMQVNLMYHPDAFVSLDEAFDPVANATYAAHFLLQLHDQTGTWPTATAWYHSATPDLGNDYERRVMAVWPEEQQHKDPAPPPVLATTYASGYASSYTGGFANGYASGFVAPNGTARVGTALAMPVRTETAHIIPLPPGAVGRTLAAYRTTPIQTVARPTPVAPPVAPVPPRGLSKPG